jgi:hypothetical protein
VCGFDRRRPVLDAAMVDRVARIYFTGAADRPPIPDDAREIDGSGAPLVADATCASAAPEPAWADTAPADVGSVDADPINLGPVAAGEDGPWSEPSAADTLERDPKAAEAAPGEPDPGCLVGLDLAASGAVTAF